MIIVYPIFREKYQIIVLSFVQENFRIFRKLWMSNFLQARTIYDESTVATILVAFMRIFPKSYYSKFAKFFFLTILKLVLIWWGLPNRNICKLMLSLSCLGFFYCGNFILYFRFEIYFSFRLLRSIICRVIFVCSCTFIYWINLVIFIKILSMILFK